MRWVCVLGLAGGCGRIAFDPTTDAGAAGLPVARSTLSFDRVTLAQPLLDIPIPIVLDAVRADATLLGNGATLRAFDANDTELPVEIETAALPLVAWVRVPQINSTTQITIEYGGTAGTLHDVWDANYLGVWHMQSPDLDSSTYGRAAALTSVGFTTGILGGAAAFASVTKSCIMVPSFSSLAFPQITMSGWMRMSAGSAAAFHTLIGRQQGDMSNDDFIIFTDPTFYPVGALDTVTNGGPTLPSANTISLAVWHHYAFTYDGARVAFHIDGVLDQAMPADGAPEVNARPLFIGCERNGSGTAVDISDGDWVDGEIDEVRIEQVGRSDAWVQYTYRAELDQVITYGPIER